MKEMLGEQNLPQKMGEVEAHMQNLKDMTGRNLHTASANLHEWYSIATKEDVVGTACLMAEHALTGRQ